MNATAPHHWGNWCRRRAHYLGYRSLGSLRSRVACSIGHLCKLLCQAAPPLKMRRGLDDALARALRVDSAMLFTHYVHFQPNSEEITHKPPQQPVETEADERVQLHSILGRLSADELKAVAPLLKAISKTN